jgi:predicted RNA binding protein with dsRBD fold (UPF0201 family)
MVEQRLRLTGRDEGLAVSVLTELRGADSPNLVLSALTQIFPEISVETMPPEPKFGQGATCDWSFDDVSLATFLNLLHEQRILDTALDAMSLNLNGEQTKFNISRMAALAGKISFPIPGELPLGGVITVELEGQGLDEWLQAATWHAGRSQVPRSINDDLAMNQDGESSTWL